MKSFRTTLATSHISAIAIAVLLFFFFEFLVRGLWAPLSAATIFLATAIAIHGMPYVSKRPTLYEEIQSTVTVLFLFEAVVSLVAAWLFSRWIYGAGPFASLKRRYPELTRRNNV